MEVNILKIFKREIYRTQDGSFKLSSKLTEFDITYSKFQTSDGTNFEMYSVPDRLKLEFNVNGSSFKFGWERHLHVLKKIQSVLVWFYDKDKKDLFYKNEAGELFYNSEYNNLVETLYSGHRDHSFIEIRPVVVERGPNKYEGVTFAVNDKASFATLTISELYDIISILTHFSFQTETDMLMRIAQTTGKISITDKATMNRFNSTNTSQGFTPAIDWSKK